MKGRFAPSPSGRMHLGNVFTALISWLSVKKAGGKWILRIEDLDPQRSKIEYARQIEDDLRWLGLHWDEGGLDNIGSDGPYLQSRRDHIYKQAYDRLVSLGLCYKCHCRRADILATQAPHESDGRVIYKATCRPSSLPPFDMSAFDNKGATRLYVPDREINFNDKVYGPQTVNLASHCGDFIIRRADNAWAYQLAVVADDAAMGVTEVVRGSDLLLSSAQQIYLYQLLDLGIPHFAHVPLICNQAMQRLSKRDQSLSMENLRKKFSPQQILGHTAFLAGITDKDKPYEINELIELFDWSKIPVTKNIVNID